MDSEGPNVVDFWGGSLSMEMDLDNGLQETMLAPRIETCYLLTGEDWPDLRSQNDFKTGQNSPAG